MGYSAVESMYMCLYLCTKVTTLPSGVAPLLQLSLAYTTIHNIYKFYMV